MTMAGMTAGEPAAGSEPDPEQEPEADASSDTAASADQARGEPIRAGMAVVDAHGDHVGSVENAEAGRGYFEAKTGGIFSRHLYIPLDAVARVDDGGAHLKVTKDNLDKLDWYLPPTNGVDLDTPYSPSPWIETGYGQGERPVPPGERARMLARDERAGVRPPSPPDLAAGTHSQAQEQARERTDTLPAALAPDASMPNGGDARGETTIAVPLAEEHLEVRTHGDAGTARVHKLVSTEPRTLEVPVAHDELRVARVPVTDETAARQLGPDAFSEKDIDVPLMGEQVLLEKRTRVTEEVVLRKHQVTEQRTYTGEVRKERVWVEGVDGRVITADANATSRVTPATEARASAGTRDIADEDTITDDRLAHDQTKAEADQP